MPACRTGRLLLRACRSFSVGGLLLLLLLICCTPAEQTGDESFSLVPEFEEQESTYICWNPKFEKVLIPLISEIAQKDHVTLFYNESFHQQQLISDLLKKHQVNMRLVDLHGFKLEKDNIWIRDYGPTYLRSRLGSMTVMGFEYPHLEYQEYGNFASQYSQKMKLPFYRSRLYSTGGGREINGMGTMILVEGYEKQVNPGLTKQEIEAEYRKALNQTNFIWLKKGLPQDDLLSDGPVIDDIYGFGVSGHIDEFCRFADASTILLTEIDPQDLARDRFYQVIHQRLEENYQILLNARDQDGQPFKIIRVPQAPVIFANGKVGEKDIFYTPVTSYLNFVVTNNSVVVPKYDVEDAPGWVKAKDQKARQAIQQAFKGREVKMIDALDLNYKGGGLHCITLSKPAKPKKSWLLRRKAVG